MTPSEVADEMHRLSELLDRALAYLRSAVKDYAQAELDYRKARAVAWATRTDGTAKEREAQVDGDTAELRYARDLADGMRQAALEAVRSRRGQISAQQTLLGAHKAEAEFVRTTGGLTP